MDKAEVFDELRRLGERRRYHGERRRRLLDMIREIIRDHRDQLSVLEMCEAAGVDRAATYRAWERMSDAESAHSDPAE